MNKELRGFKQSFFNNTAEGVTVNEGVVLFEKGKENLLLRMGKIFYT